ncbi:LysM peptidoglycan-binding domain-containing protein [Oceanibium sediminis]|uniref:LysM peptidoglycan-binding domain-containing protein n=1 Tax=Oceanibium sediminis TaxID=2026339 RepID=UPI000DD2E004|nr:LysM peptidoglycan-binding domain-containing protein [Oceanibium sediminis]
MSIRYISGPVVLSLVIGLAPMAIGATPSQGGQAGVSATPAPVNIRFAQAGLIDQATRRRLEFYAKRVMSSLLDLAEDDLRTADGTALPDPAVTEAFRDSLTRYARAAQEAGVDTDTMSLLLEEVFDLTYEGPVPSQLLNSDGLLDGDTLIATSLEALAQETASKQAQKVDYLAVVASEGSDVREDRLSRLKAEPSTDPEQIEEVTQEVAEAEEPEPEPESPSVDPEVQAVLDRIEGSGESRVIRIERGDTLGLIARAVYGDSLRYREIFALNRSKLNNPDTLPVGAVLDLPSS